MRNDDYKHRLPLPWSSFFASLLTIFVTINEPFGPIAMDNKAKQYKWECNLWLGTIESLQNENTFLNNHVGEIASEKLSVQELAVLEVLMDKILENDMLLHKMRSDICRMSNYYDIICGDVIDKYLLVRHVEMRHAIATAELQIHSFKTYFCTELVACA